MGILYINCPVSFLGIFVSNFFGTVSLQCGESDLMRADGGSIPSSWPHSREEGYSQRVLNDLQRTSLSRRRTIWLLPHHLFRQQVVSLSQSSCVSPVELFDGRKDLEGGGGAKSYDGENAWPSINHSTLSGYSC
jgi:hypothetical protein